MNYAVILSGGIGTRMHMGDFPKQYYKVKGKMMMPSKSPGQWTRLSL